MKFNANKIIAIDGHDGSGKSTLAKLLSEQINGIYLRPFGGDAGTQLLDYAEKKDYKRLSLFGKEQITKVTSAYHNEILICDRHWMTVFTLLPEEFWNDNMWFPLPSTILCYSEIEVTLNRLGERKENEFDSNYHSYYLSLYLKLSKKFGIVGLRTDQNSIKECLRLLVHWYSST